MCIQQKHIGITSYLTCTATSVSLQHLLSDSCIVQLSCQVSSILKTSVLTARYIKLRRGGTTLFTGCLVQQNPVTGASQ